MIMLGAFVAAVRNHFSPPGLTLNVPPDVTPSLEPPEGWHCTHYFYRFDRARLNELSPEDRRHAADDFLARLQPAEHGPRRLQKWLISGHQADFSLMVLDPHPLVVDAVHQRLMASQLGPVLVPCYSFVSLTEVSEYAPTVEQFGQRLAAEGLKPGTDDYEKRLRGYAQREPMMRKQRLTPDLPDWPAVCFYPMNKKRKVGENWFLLPLEERQRLMAEHARSGMEFAGKVSQLITVSIGLDDWEWGVTLWAKNPKFLTDIVYRMRFDEASARYAEFGPFFVGYQTSADQIVDHCRLI